jgi:PAS domain S-box-containing protein
MEPQNGQIEPQTGDQTTDLLDDLDLTRRNQAARAPEHQARVAGLISDVSLALTCEDPLSGQLQRCAEALVQHADAAFARIWTLEAGQDVLELVASAGMYTRIDGTYARIPLSGLKIGRIALEKNPILTNQVVDDANVSDHEWARREGIVSFVGYPLLIGERVVGVMAMFARHSLDRTVLKAISSIASTVAVGIARKQTETSLRLSEAQFRFLAECSLDLISRRTAQGVFLYVSPASRLLLGLEPDEITGQTLEHLIHPDDREIVRTAIETVLAGSDPKTFTYRIRRKDGTYTWFESISRAVRDPADMHVLQIHGVARDVSERVRNEGELRLARDELEQRVRERTAELVLANATLEGKAKELARSNAELQQFAYVASHDLQEPLRKVSSFTQLLARRYKGRLDADADEFIDYVVDGVNRMKQLINDLLAYSRVGTRGEAFEPVAVHEVLQRALANLLAAIDETGAMVTHEDLPVVMGDRSQLSQLFQNLIGNAIKYRGEEPPCVHVSVRRDGAEWHFAVGDNGIGIDPQYADRVFEIFQRLHTRTQYPGSGIGLAISRKIVERHGGLIWVESQEGKGSVFHFTIPTNGTDMGAEHAQQQRDS